MLARVSRVKDEFVADRERDVTESNLARHARLVLVSLLMSTDTHEALGWVPSDAEFATRLAMVRQHMGWNAKEAALACGLPAQSWREWETLGRRPRDLVQVCQQIAARTGVHWLWLLTGQTEPGAGPMATAVIHQYLTIAAQRRSSAATRRACGNWTPYQLPPAPPQAA